MAEYQHKAGSLSLFKNTRKEKETHPDYNGSGLDLEGNPVWISGWIKKGAKGTFLSINLKKKEIVDQTPKDDDLNDDIPF